MKTISILLPVYNEAEVIDKFHNAISKQLAILPQYLFEIIYVVDKCKDNTLEILKSIAAESDNVIILALSKRFGHQMSLVAGMDRCTGDAAIMMDCDLEHPPSMIPVLLERFEQGFDVVHTKRTYHEKISPIKRMTSNLYYHMLSSLSSVELEEGSADFRLISRKCLDIFNNSIREQNQFLRGLFRWVGLRQCTVEFTASQRGGGRSKYTIKRLCTFAISGIISFSKVPLTLSTMLGGIFAIIGFIYGIYTIFISIFTGSTPQGWPSTIALIAFLGGLQLSVLGILGRYVGEIFDEVKRRPLYIIEEEYHG